MRRRRFLSASGGALFSAAPFISRLRTQLSRDVQVNGERLLQTLRALSQFGRTEEGGINRVAFSEADRSARAYVTDLMRSAGLDVSVDFAGNLIGHRPGRGPNLTPIMLGSHIDSVPSGGNFDGQVGSMGAVEVAHTLQEHNVQTQHPLEFVIFTNEEAGKTGSRAMSGEVGGEELSIGTPNGKTIGEGLVFVGGDPTRLDEVRREPGSVAGYLELHVEQGAELHRNNIDIGVVEGIVGIKRWNVTIEGFANHAGTTPMDQRRDALLAAGMFIQLVNKTARGVPGRHVATVGRLEVHPGAPNVIPGRVVSSLEIRDLDMNRIDEVFEAIEAGRRSIENETGTAFTFDQFYVSYAAPTDPAMRDDVERAATELQLRTTRMPSGAGHDAQSIARLGPVGMVFVPSVDGISHSPRERTEGPDVIQGADVLLKTLLLADERL